MKSGLTPACLHTPISGEPSPTETTSCRGRRPLPGGSHRSFTRKATKKTPQFLNNLRDLQAPPRLASCSPGIEESRRVQNLPLQKSARQKPAKRASSNSGSTLRKRHKCIENKRLICFVWQKMPSPLQPQPIAPSPRRAKRSNVKLAYGPIKVE